MTAFIPNAKTARRFKLAAYRSKYPLLRVYTYKGEVRGRSANGTRATFANLDDLTTHSHPNGSVDVRHRGQAVYWFTPIETWAVRRNNF